MRVCQGYLSQLAGLSGDALAQRFAQIAEKESDCGSAKSGGDLGVFESGQMMAAFEEATAALAGTPPLSLSLSLSLPGSLALSRSSAL